MVTVISNPTTSFQLLIPCSSSASAASHVCKITSKLNVQKPNCLTNLSCFSKKRVLFQSQSQPKLGSRFRRSVVSCGGVAEIDQTQFSEIVLKSETPVLVEFVADWCGPCKLISPAIEWASKEYEDRLKVVKINHDLNPQLIEEYKVYGLPALIIFKNGKEVPASRREGAMTKAKLKDYIDAILESAAVI